MAGLASEMVAALRTHEEVFRYWKSLRRPGRLPSRRDLDPVCLARHLPTISLIDVLSDNPANNPALFRQRLAGTGLFPAYGTEITGKSLDNIYSEAEAQYWAEELTAIHQSGRAGVGLHSMAWRGARGLSLFWLRLPLASDGHTVDMILGHDALIGKIELGQTGIRAA